MNLIATKNFLGNTTKQFEFDDFKISIVDYTQKVSEEWHWHEKIHISSILQGGTLESRKHQEIQATPDKILAYDQGEIHRNRFTAHPSKNLNIEFEDNFFKEDIHFAGLDLNQNANIEFLKIYFELQLNDTQSKESIYQIVKSLFWKDSYDSKGDWVQQLKEMLHDRWDEFPSLNDLAQELKVHPITISKYFAKYSGMTLSEYMRKLKVKKALELLINSPQSLVEIALQCGFSYQSHMNRLVKNYTGFTPKAIRSI